MKRLAASVGLASALTIGACTALVPAWPAAVAAQVDARAGADHGVFVVWAGTYRTLEGQCEALVGALNERRGNMQFVVGDQGEKYYEHGNLTWFPAKG